MFISSTLIDDAFPSTWLLTRHTRKAAGGTIQSRYNKIWNTGLKHCHPHPCIQPQWSTNKEAHPYVMLPLRDPIDRFHSSFYWRVLRVCHPDPEQQITNYKELQGRDWECEKGGNGNGYEGQAIHVTYQQNASKLALDLCSADPALEQAARKTISLLGHAQHNVRDWMAFDWQPERVYTIVVEKGFASIEDQTDEALRWIWNNTHFEDPSDFHRRSEYAYQHGPKIAQTPNGAHSSAALKEPLTPAAIHCLRSFYKEEYDFFSELSQKTCKNVRCEAAIENILIRRSWTGAN